MENFNKAELEAMVQELESALCYLEERIGRGKSFKPGRKEEVLEVLRTHKRISVADIAKTLNISSRNVSSQLSYLRKDGFEIGSDSKGRKMLIES